MASREHPYEKGPEGDPDVCNGTKKLVAPKHTAAKARAGCHKGRRLGKRRCSNALVPQAQGVLRTAEQHPRGVHVAGAAGNLVPCALCEHREEHGWGSMKTVQPQVGGHIAPEQHTTTG